MWLDRDDLRQIRALASLEGKHPFHACAEAIRYARKCRSHGLVLNVESIDELSADEPPEDTRAERLRAVIAAMRAEAASAAAAPRTGDPYYVAKLETRPRVDRHPARREAAALELVLSGAEPIEVAHHFGVSKAAAEVLLVRARKRAREVLRRMEAA